MWVGFDYSDQIGASKITMATAKCGGSSLQCNNPDGLVPGRNLLTKAYHAFEKCLHTGVTIHRQPLAHLFLFSWQTYVTYIFKI